MLEKTLESSLDCKEIQPVHSKGDQPWVFFGRNGAKAETPVLWLPDAKSQGDSLQESGKSGLHAHGDGERVFALESRARVPHTARRGA